MKPYRYLHCSCPDTAKRGERCTRNIARCQSRVDAFVDERRLNDGELTPKQYREAMAAADYAKYGSNE